MGHDKTLLDTSYDTVTTGRREDGEWKIARWGEPVLHRACRPVTDFGPDLWNLLCDMFATNKAANGAGLAAPQIGVDPRPDVAVCHSQDQFGDPSESCAPADSLGASSTRPII